MILSLRRGLEQLVDERRRRRGPARSCPARAACDRSRRCSVSASIGDRSRVSTQAEPPGHRPTAPGRHRATWSSATKNAPSANDGAQPLGRADRQAGLAGPARAGQGHEPVVADQGARRPATSALPADEAGQRLGRLAAPGVERAERREVGRQPVDRPAGRCAPARSRSFSRWWPRSRRLDPAGQAATRRAPGRPPRAAPGRRAPRRRCGPPGGRRARRSCRRRAALAGMHARCGPGRPRLAARSRRRARAGWRPPPGPRRGALGKTTKNESPSVADLDAVPGRDRRPDQLGCCSSSAG